MTASLRDKTFSAVFWNGLQFAGRQGIQMITIIILARLLAPDKFGLIAMLTIFMAVATTFVESGFGAALIQRQNASQIDCSSIFYFNLAAGLGASTALWLSAPLIAAFYQEPLLVPLTRFLSLRLVIDGFASVQRNLCRKHLDYRRLAVIEFGANLLGGAVGITMALRGAGVWALAWQQISAHAFRSVFFWIKSDWYPSLELSFASLRKMFGYGSKMLASGLLNNAFRNIYLLIIGWAFTPAALGFYTLALRIRRVPTEGLATVVGNVMFPVFASIQEEPERVKRGMRKSIGVLCLFNFPIMAGLAVTARPLIGTLLGEDWLPAAPLLQILAVAGLVFPLHVVNLNPLKALGRSDLFLRLEVLKKLLTLTNIAVTFRWGVQAMVTGQTLASFAAYYLNSHYTGRLVQYPIQEQIKDLMPNFGISLIMGGTVFLIGMLPFPNFLSLLLSQIAVGGIVYLLLCLLFRFEAVNEAKILLQQKLPFLKITG